LFINWDIGKDDGKSFQNQKDNSLISLAHGGSGLRGRDFIKRMKEKQVIKK
jgi:hypothetical protein